MKRLSINRYIKYIFLIRIYLSIVLVIGTNEAFAIQRDFSQQELPKKKVVKILSIDGGGVRGIIPAIILKKIEKDLPKGKNFANSFDIISGTSSGGIIALMLTTPNNFNKPRYNAAQIVEIYRDLSRKIFKQSIWQFIKSGNGWWDAKYSAKMLEKLLDNYLEDATLKDSLTNVIIPAYEIQMDKTFFFKSVNSKIKPERNFYIKDLARATSAAPTYFRPTTITNLNGKEFTFIDGGISSNNPTLASCVHAIELYGTNVDLFVVSIGTGTNYGAATANIAAGDVKKAGMIKWADKIIPLMMYAANDIVNYEMHKIFMHSENYIRLQTTIETQDFYMDNSSISNIRKLEDYAAKIIDENKHEIKKIVETLSK